MKIRTFRYFAQESWRSVKFNGLMSLHSIYTVALSLLLVGLVLMGGLLIDHLVRYVENQVEVDLFLADGLRTDQTQVVLDQLKKLPHISKVKYIPKDEGLKQWQQQMGDYKDVVAELGSQGNPLPDQIQLQIDDPRYVSQVSKIVSGIPEVERVRDGGDAVERLVGATQLVRWLSLVFILFTGFDAVLIVANTVRAAVAARKREVGIMKLVGATDWFIRLPFLIEGLLFGLAGSLVAIIALNPAYAVLVTALRQGLPFIPMPDSWTILFPVVSTLLVAGVVLGGVGSYVSLRKYLRV